MHPGAIYRRGRAAPLPRSAGQTAANETARSPGFAGGEGSNPPRQPQFAHIGNSSTNHTHRDQGRGRGQHNRGGRGRGQQSRGGRGRGGQNNGYSPAFVPTSVFPQADRQNQPNISAVDENDVSTWRQKDFQLLVNAFIANEESQELCFPPSLSAKHRSIVHRIAMAFRLDHKSSGPASARVLKLTKSSGSVSNQQLQQDAALEGMRIKTIDGYQGAQELAADFLLPHVEEVITSLTPHQARMYRNIKTEANRASTNKQHLRIPQPGMASVPKIAKDAARYEEIQRFRRTLPSYKDGKNIVHAVENNDVVIVCGDTGCGKTTQIPQILYDSGIFPSNMSILCTQPRRISALSVAKRVADERGEACGDSCGYIIRFENVTSERTRIVYETTGILLRRLHSESELHGVACVVVDEVHERDVDTDFCLLLLRDRLLAQQRDSSKYPTKLKVVVMSATIQIDKLVDYFTPVAKSSTIPVINIPGTLFPVTEYFLEDAIKWVDADPSSIAAMGLQRPKEAVEASADGEEQNNTLYDKLKSNVFSDVERDVEAMVPFDLIVKLVLHMHQKSDDLSGTILVFLPGWSAINRIAEMLRRSPFARQCSILLLHSSLTSAEQERVFKPAPKRFRKVVLATSIAETSITIDDVVYVIDSGLMKGTTYNPAGNTSSLRATLIGKANGVQRRGRAGRCRAGICVHLLPHDVYEARPDFLPPEIIRSPLEEVCLQVKAISPDEQCSQILQRALDSPPMESITHATQFLTEIGAFTERDQRLTNLGHALAQLPVHPLLGKMLFAAACFGVLDSVATIAAGLSVKSPFINPQPWQRSALWDSMQHLDQGDLSDHICLVKLYQGWLKSGRSVQYASAQLADQAVLRSLDRTQKQLVNLVLRSPLVRQMRDPLRFTSRYTENTGLVRLVVLWSLYPRIASVEFTVKRGSQKPDIFCWDNKPAVVSRSSILMGCKRNVIKDRTFIMYYERMQLESMLNLFDSSCMSPVDVALCLRQLTVRPLATVPALLLTDDESRYQPVAPLDVDMYDNKNDYAAMFFDGDKKLYVAHKRVALALQMARECMDYYLALSIKKLRANLFPDELIRAIALTIGYPVHEIKEVRPAAMLDSTTTAAVSAESLPAEVGNTPTFARGYVSDSGSSDDDEGPIMDDVVGDEFLGLSAEQKEKVLMAFGDLAIFRHDAADSLLAAARAAPTTTSIPGGDEPPTGNEESGTKTVVEPAEEVADDYDDEEEDIIVATANELTI